MFFSGNRRLKCLQTPRIFIGGILVVIISHLSLNTLSFLNIAVSDNAYSHLYQELSQKITMETDSIYHCSRKLCKL